MGCSKGYVRKEQRAEVGMVEQGHSWFWPRSLLQMLKFSKWSVTTTQRRSGRNTWSAEGSRRRAERKERKS